MDETKRAYRETETAAKEAWRNRDGEDPADAVGNLGDQVRKGLGNAGDDIRAGLREAGDDARRAGERADADVSRHGAIDDPADPGADLDRPM